MNYFPFHIGDYAAHTGHLEPMEDLAYRRLLDLYYLRESPIPLDVQTTAKLIRMRSMAADVEAVLKEFFIVTNEGWAHTRVDAELSKMREKQGASEERDEHEKTRMQKHRERRSVMFAQLAEVGFYPPFNAKTGELEALIAANCGAPVTALVTPQFPNGVTAPVTALVTDVTAKTSPVTAPATAIPTPTPTPTPTPVSIPPLPPTGGACRFEEFWNAWPKSERKQDKVKCATKWKRQQLDNLADSILADIGIKRHTEKWRDGFMEAPLVYLNGRRWEDGVEANGSQTGSNDWTGSAL